MTPARRRHRSEIAELLAAADAFMGLAKWPPGAHLRMQRALAAVRAPRGAKRPAPPPITDGAIARGFVFVRLLIGCENGVSIDEAARQLGCHTRTIYRYVAAASAAGLVEWHVVPGLGRRVRLCEQHSAGSLAE